MRGMRCSVQTGSLIYSSHKLSVMFFSNFLINDSLNTFGKIVLEPHLSGQRGASPQVCGSKCSPHLYAKH